MVMWSVSGTTLIKEFPCLVVVFFISAPIVSHLQVSRVMGVVSSRGTLETSVHEYLQQIKVASIIKRPHRGIYFHSIVSHVDIGTTFEKDLDTFNIGDAKNIRFANISTQRN